MLKGPPGDTNGLGEDEVTVTSGPHAQAEKRANKHKEKRKLHPGGAQTKVRNRVMMLKHGGAPLVADGRLCRQPEYTG